MFGQIKKAIEKQPYEVLMDSVEVNYTNPERAAIFIDAYIAKAKEARNKKEEFKGLYLNARLLGMNRQLAEAEAQYKELLDFSIKHNLTEETILAYDIGAGIQTAVPNFALALERYNKGLHLAEEINNEVYREMELIKISNLLDVTGDVPAAIKIRKKTTALYEEKPLDTSYTESVKSGTLTYAYFLLFNSYLKIEKIDSARYYNKRIKEVVKTSDSCYAKYLYFTNAEIALEDRKFNTARKNYTLFYETCLIDMPIIKLKKAYQFGKVEMEASNYNEATRFFEQGLSDYEVSPEEEAFMEDYYKLMANAYKETGQFEKAGYFFEKYLLTRDGKSKLKDDVVRASKQEETKKFKEELAKLEAEKEQSQDYLNYLFFGATIVILGLLFFLLKFYRNKKANEAKFEALLAKIEAAQSPKEIIDTKDETLEEKETTDVSEETKQQILAGLKKLEEKEYFLQQDCNSYNVAKKIGTNTSYLSKVINSHFGKNFNTYINDLRINYAIVRIKNDVLFRSYSIQSIAEEIGYKSADSFTKYFKKDTGLNPSFYIKNIKNIA